MPRWHRLDRPDWEGRQMAVNEEKDDDDEGKAAEESEKQSSSASQRGLQSSWSMWLMCMQTKVCLRFPLLYGRKNLVKE